MERTPRLPTMTSFFRSPRATLGTMDYIEGTSLPDHRGIKLVDITFSEADTVAESQTLSNRAFKRRLGGATSVDLGIVGIYM